MLDQNTDRMWFVIGAVIVGAAIIFIANGTMPTLFASVKDSFEESANKGIEVIEEISPATHQIMPIQGAISHNQEDWDYGSLVWNTGLNHGSNRTLRSKYIFLEAGDYEVKFIISPSSEISQIKSWMHRYDEIGDRSEMGSGWKSDDTRPLSITGAGQYVRILIRPTKMVQGEYQYFNTEEALRGLLGSDMKVELYKIDK